MIHLDQKQSLHNAEKVAKYLGWFHPLAYGLLILFAVFWVEINELPIWVVVVTTFPLILADLFSDYSPRFVAKVYTHRITTIWAVFLLCAISAFLFTLFTPDLSSKFLHIEAVIKKAIHYFVLGGIGGLVMRMLMINLFADIIRAKSVHRAKLLIMLAWLVFIILFPFGRNAAAAVFMIGFGCGFVIHYHVRPQEKQKMRVKRLKENILNMIRDPKKRDGKASTIEDARIANLTRDEETALTLYINEKWDELPQYIQSVKETDIIFFIRLSMLRKLHKYEVALQLITERIAKGEISDNINFYYLHAALNESERFDHEGNWKYRDDIFDHLEKAYQLNPDCLLTCVTYALRIAGELPSNFTPKESTERHNECLDMQKKALALIWKGMQLYEAKPEAKLLSAITGFTVPVTYTLLLDTYGYVLLKCGKTKFSIALILQSLFQDPTFSATYLHLAEWYMDYYGELKNRKDKTEHPWQKAAKVNLYIAIEMEKQNDIEKKGTFISITANKLLQQLL